MKILIVYYSRTGQTHRVAQDLAKHLSADSEELIDTTKRSGILGYLSGGRDAMKKSLTTLQPTSHNPADYDFVTIGLPVWGWNLTPAIRTYLAEHGPQIKKYAFFVTSGNTDAVKLLPCFAEVMPSEPQAYVGFSTAELQDATIYENKMQQFISQLQ